MADDSNYDSLLTFLDTWAYDDYFVAFFELRHTTGQHSPKHVVSGANLVPGPAQHLISGYLSLNELHHCR